MKRIGILILTMKLLNRNNKMLKNIKRQQIVLRFIFLRGAINSLHVQIEPQRARKKSRGNSGAAIAFPEVFDRLS
jgi:hypothetical protein